LYLCVLGYFKEPSYHQRRNHLFAEYKEAIQGTRMHMVTRLKIFVNMTPARITLGGPWKDFKGPGTHNAIHEYLSISTELLS